MSIEFLSTIIHDLWSQRRLPINLVWWKMKKKKKPTHTTFSVGSEVSKMRKRERNVEFFEFPLRQ